MQSIPFTLPRNAQIWLPGYAKSLLRHRRQARKSASKRVWLMIADHFEPWSVKLGQEDPEGIVERWRNLWPRIAVRHRDAAGRPACYTFFYPEEQYQPHLIDPLAEMAASGVADVEVHIHHGGEGEAEFVRRMRRFTEDFLHTRHGLLRVQQGNIAFGFIHGNWALDNSRPDGRWCGLNNELILLRQLGCYADFTLPSAPSATQTQTVNTVYWATDDPLGPKSHNSGTPVSVGGRACGDLLIIPGPLGLNCRGEGRLLPRLETGELAGYDPPTPSRIATWLDCAPRLGQDVFIKLFTHGAQPRNADMLLNGGIDGCLESLSAECGRRGLELYFASAWEMFQAVEAVRNELDPRSVLSRPVAGSPIRP